jgi:hypothetical protein
MRLHEVIIKGTLYDLFPFFKIFAFGPAVDGGS